MNRKPWFERFGIHAVAMLFALGLSGCGSSPTGSGGGGSPNFTLAAAVNGLVTDLAGEPLGQAGISVTTFLKETTCATQPLAPPVESVADEEGNYSITLTYNGLDKFDACLTLVATAPPDFPDLRPTFSQREIEVRPLGDGIERVRVDFILAP